MSYLLQIMLLLSIFSCVLLSDAFWSWSCLISKEGSTGLFCKSCVIVTSLTIYAGIDYFMLDYLMLVPGKIYVVA